ncbi:hypothetical protein AMTR_s00138p00014860, partial [Amborella trichopoda]
MATCGLWHFYAALANFDRPIISLSHGRPLARGSVDVVRFRCGISVEPTIHTDMAYSLALFHIHVGHMTDVVPTSHGCHVASKGQGWSVGPLCVLGGAWSSWGPSTLVANISR